MSEPVRVFLWDLPPEDSDSIDEFPYATVEFARDPGKLHESIGFFSANGSGELRLYIQDPRDATRYTRSAMVEVFKRI